MYCPTMLTLVLLSILKAFLANFDPYFMLMAVKNAQKSGR